MSIYRLTQDGVRTPYLPEGADPADREWDPEEFKNNLRVSIGSVDEEEIEFDLVGLDPSLANAFRRIMISEVPTIAIEHVFVWTNTSIVVDEVLSQRLGLVNLKINPQLLTKRNSPDPTDLNTVVFKLNVQCTKNPRAPTDTRDPKKLYNHSSVYSGDLVWDPVGMQKSLFGEDDPPRPVHDDILLAKLRPGQEIILELHCEKNIGKEHAKWSPVATASYRLLPSIKILKPIPSELCDKFASCFSPGVAAVHTDPSTKQKSVSIVNPRKDTVSREVLRHPEFQDSVQLGRVKDHFIFSVESTGAYPASHLLPAAVEILLNKIKTLRSSLTQYEKHK